MKVCVAITADRQVDPRWGRAGRVAVAEVADGEIRDWQELTVAWGTLHDQRTEGAHHARIARFLRDNQVQAIAVHHVGPGMERMLGSMAIRVVTGLSGDARRPSRLCDHGLGTALVRGGYHRYRLLPRKPTPHKHVPPGKPPFNILDCGGARCVAGVGVDVLRGDVQRVLFADIPPRNYTARVKHVRHRLPGDRRHGGPWTGGAPVAQPARAAVEIDDAHHPCLAS